MIHWGCCSGTLALGRKLRQRSPTVTSPQRADSLLGQRGQSHSVRWTVLHFKQWNVRVTEMWEQCHRAGDRAHHWPWSAFTESLLWWPPQPLCPCSPSPTLSIHGTASVLCPGSLSSGRLWEFGGGFFLYVLSHSLPLLALLLSSEWLPPAPTHQHQNSAWIPDP